LRIVLARSREPADEAARERVPRARRIREPVHGIGGRDEALVRRLVERAMLALLDDHRLRALLEQAIGRARQLDLAGQRARFLLVQQRDIDAPQARRARDPAFRAIQ
jgi:hypothetical protein